MSSMYIYHLDISEHTEEEQFRQTSSASYTHPLLRPPIILESALLCGAAVGRSFPNSVINKCLYSVGSYSHSNSPLECSAFPLVPAHVQEHGVVLFELRNRVGSV
ncbi:hypothetical protein GOODEAATRI_014427, partial [Goodea atripinnis]